ncbi:MAG: hypothetical protein RBT74_16655 [Tenuifilaceae bacterium]|jgi:hypothetical protein|nr:hypothetical protein [Tenuifilaceae bacterium]
MIYKISFLNFLSQAAIVIFLSSCFPNESEQNNIHRNTTIKIDSLIAINKDKLLFLNFWSGMDKDEFEAVKEFENQNGRLFDDKFVIKFYDNKMYYHLACGVITHSSNTYPTVSELQLNLKYEEGTVQLYLKEQLKNNLNKIKDNTSRPKYVENLEKYESLILHLIKTYDNKYIRTKIEPLEFNYKTNTYSWITNDKNPIIIQLTAYIESAFYKKWIKGTDSGLDAFVINGDLKKQKEYSEINLYAEGIEPLMHDCEIVISYQLYSDYLNKLEEKRLIEEKNEQHFIKQKEKEKLELNKNNDVL